MRENDGSGEDTEALVEPLGSTGPSVTPKIANYHILKRSDGKLFRLGLGTIGITYKAFDSSLDRHVALKVIPTSVWPTDEERERFLREARAAAKMRHPHVAAIYDFGQAGAEYFYAMEFVDGPDLEHYVQIHGPLSASAALGVALQIAGALEAGQAHKLIHREIMPANILVHACRGGNLDIKLVDFGLTKDACLARESSYSVSDQTISGWNLLYASPEQCKIGELDTRSDIYSLGATLWYLLVGSTPFEGNVNQVLIAQVTKPPPFQRLQGLPAPLVELLRRMLAKDPGDRPKDPTLLKETIGNLIEKYSWARQVRLGDNPERLPPGSLEGTAIRSEGETHGSVLLPAFDVYRSVKVGALIAERYRLIEIRAQGDAGQLFLADDTKSADPGKDKTALVLVHPEIVLQAFESLQDEINLIKGIAHPNLVAYYGLQNTGSGAFVVREWVHGLSLFELLRLRRSFAPEEVLALLEPLPALLELISVQGLGLVDVSIKKIMISCPTDLAPAQFSRLAKDDVWPWTKCALKFNALNISQLRFRENPYASIQTFVPSNQMSQSLRTGISGRRAVRLLGGLVYELIKGQAPSQQGRERPSPLPSLTETGNRALRRALAMTSESGSYQSCEEFWQAFKENIADRTSRASRHREGTNPYSTAEGRYKPGRLEARESGATSTPLDKMRPRRAGIVGISLAILVCACAGLICFEFIGSKQQSAVASPKSLSRPTAELTPSPIHFASDLMGEAQRNLASQDFADALPILRKVADDGDPMAMDYLGVLYQTGKGVPHDSDQAREWFQKAAEAGNLAGVTNLGAIYGNGEGMHEDYDKAFECSLKGAEAGNTVAMTNLGLLLKNAPAGSKESRKAYGWFQKAADSGQTIAMTNLGLLYETGNGFPQDYTKARQWYRKAVSAGNAIAMTLLGLLQEEGKGGPRDYSEARRCYEKAAGAGDKNAMNYLGLLYERGKGVPQDYGKAREWYEKAADANNLVAMINIALLCEAGAGGSKDFDLADTWYQKAVETGNGITVAKLGLLYDDSGVLLEDTGGADDWFGMATDARDMINVAWLYEQGKGVPKDSGKAREWFERAAHFGNAVAMRELGSLYQNGQGIPQDWGKALEWFKKAATIGDIPSMTSLGLMYQNGQGVTQDNGKAREWYQGAAQSGDPIAMTNLAVLYFYGRGGPQDYAKALAWFEQAANAGNTNAMFNLGLMYRDGRYVAQDYQRARDWFQRAADAGNADAKEAVENLRSIPR
jgi:TPR repeat protein/serine/threonine protein kinase